MTWRTNPNRQSGFTLIEMIVVLVVLGLVFGLVITRGPMHSATLDARTAAREVAQALRLARSRAIVSDRLVSVRIDGLRYQSFPRAVGMAAISPTGQPIVSIRFAPNGRSSGARITLAERGSVRYVVVDWLTGRVSVDDPG